MADNIRAWISASRPRTLPLAAASICMGGFLAYFQGLFDLTVFFLTLSTTLLLQILSNLANDYGDHQHGADHHGRIGPARMVQSGNISPEKMKAAIVGLAGVTLLLGICLLISSVGFNNPAFYIFLVLGLVCIAAAVNYTSGKKPYGYQGWGDLSVLIFFGPVAVFGSYFLQTFDFQWYNLLPAVSCGLFATAVLNINNIRDMESDKKAGKLSIPVRIGSANAIKYHWMLLVIALSCSVLFALVNYSSVWQWSFLVVIPLLLINGKAIQNNTGSALDPYLKQMVLTTLIYVITFGIGLVITSSID
jgi:1,4-dihydroxy-2-naphthoate octaprenyltransferase